MKLRVLSHGDWMEAWRRLPNDRREVYWHPAYSAASARWEGAEPECLTIEDGDRWFLYPYLRHPIRGFDSLSQPRHDVQTAYGYGGPLFIGRWDGAGKTAALGLAYAYLRSTGVVAEFVRCHTHWVDLDALRHSGYATPQVRTDVLCRLSGRSPLDLVKDWPPPTGRNLRRARRSGLRHRLTDGAGAAGLKRLYDMTVERLDMGPAYRFDLEYFSAITALDRRLVKVVLVEADGDPPRPVAGGMLFIGGRMAHSHLRGWDPTYRMTRPNDFLYWAQAVSAAAAGCELICWGGGLSTDPADSLYRFKSRFGDVHVPVHIGCRVIDRDAYDALCDEWAHRNPEKAETTRLFLRYRA